MSDIRPHEISVPIQEPDDARLFFIGRIHTPWKDRKDCPRQGKVDGPECRIEIFEPWVPALKGIEEYDRIELLYWLDKARRDLIVQNPAHSDNIFGTFASALARQAEPDRHRSGKTRFRRWSEPDRARA